MDKVINKILLQIHKRFYRLKLKKVYLLWSYLLEIMEHIFTNQVIESIEIEQQPISQAILQ